MELPKTLTEAIVYFADEESCHNRMVAMRWGNGNITCPRCQSQNVGKLVVTQHKSRSKKEGVEPKTLTRRLWNCGGCKKQFTVKTGTIFEESPLSLSKWLPAVWMLVGAKNGVSSYELHRALGITQKSAWFLAHRIRRALHDGHFNMMTGVVEADETFIGGKARNMHRHKQLEKGATGGGSRAMTPVQGLLERNVRKGHSRVKAKVIPNMGSGTMRKTVRDYVLTGSKLMTDAHHSYKKLNGEFEHQFVDHAVAYVNGQVHTNGLENFWSLLKRSIHGTYVCPRPFHLFRYLDEQSFRFNERKGTDSERFDLAMAGVSGKRLTYKVLTGK